MNEAPESLREAPSFHEALSPTLSLTIAGTKLVVGSGDIRSFELAMRPWGFDCRVDFWQQNNQPSGGKEADPVFAPFIKADLIEATFKVSSDYLKRSLKAQPEPIEVTGLVRSKAVVEDESLQVKGLPVLHRLYTVEFADPAQVLWRQHWPSQLYVGKAFKDVLEDHKGAYIKLEHKLAALTVRHPVLCLGLGVFDPRASFYDLVCWYLTRWHGHLRHDPVKKTYTIDKEKPAAGAVAALSRLDVDSWQLRFSETPRWDVHVLNGSAVDARDEPITQDQTVKGVRRDILLRTDIASEMTDRKTVEAARLKVPLAQVRVWFGQFPEVQITPGSLLKLEGGRWSAGLAFKGKQYRGYGLRLSGRGPSLEADRDHGADYTEFEVTLSIDLEEKEDTRQRIPLFIPPSYPIEVEGTVVSEKGEEPEETWHLYEDADTSVEEYKVEIPLWEKQQIVAPFLPSMTSGHFYFPAYKGERVLVALHFDHAEIRRFLDWRPGARLAQNTFGNQVFMGHTETDRTSMKHVYEDKKPVFQLHRRHEKDVGTVRIEEGVMILRIEEEKG